MRLLKDLWYGIFVPCGLILSMIPVGVIVLIYTIGIITDTVKGDHMEWLIEEYIFWATDGLDLCLRKRGYYN